MLEALCSLSHSEDRVARQGDVIVLALPGHPWGTEERKTFFLVKWEDAALEATLRGREQRGAAWPVQSLPYATFDERRKFITRATKCVNVDTLVNKAEILDVSRESAILELGAYSLRVVEIVEPGILTRTFNALKSAWNWLVG